MIPPPFWENSHQLLTSIRRPTEDPARGGDGRRDLKAFQVDANPSPFMESVLTAAAVLMSNSGAEHFIYSYVDGTTVAVATGRSCEPEKL